MKKRIYTVVGLLFMAVSLVLVGCSADGESALSLNDSGAVAALGTIILKVNPEIAIDYNDYGEVTNIRALNEDGEEIVNDYKDFIGKNSDIVLEELIKLIGDAGYFVEEIEGKSKRIVIELEAGSKLPADDFLVDIAKNTQEAVKEFTSTSEVSLEDAEELNIEEIVETSTPKEEKPAEKATAENLAKATYLSHEQAKEIALNHAKVNKENARFDSEELDTDDGVMYYDLEFEVGQNEYEYEIDAISGRILEFEHDLEEEKKAPVATEQAPQAKELSKDQAINIALKHAGVSRAEVSFDDVELDTDDGRKIWEISFDAGNWEFEYEIDALTSKIIDSKKEHDD